MASEIIILNITGFFFLQGTFNKPSLNLNTGIPSYTEFKIIIRHC